MFSIVVVPIYIPTCSVGENVNWSHFNQCFLFADFFFNDGHSDWCEVVVLIFIS